MLTISKIKRKKVKKIMASKTHLGNLFRDENPYILMDETVVE